MKYSTCKNTKQICPKLMITYNFPGVFLQRKAYFNTKALFFVLLRPENEFLPKFWTISGHNNEEIAIKHGKKIYVKFMKGFSGLLHINITRHYGNLNAKYFLWWYPLKYIQNKWKNQFEVETVFIQKIEAETLRNS